MHAAGINLQPVDQHARCHRARRAVFIQLRDQLGPIEATVLSCLNANVRLANTNLAQMPREPEQGVELPVDVQMIEARQRRSIRPRQTKMLDGEFEAERIESDLADGNAAGEFGLYNLRTNTLCNRVDREITEQQVDDEQRDAGNEWGAEQQCLDLGIIHTSLDGPAYTPAIYPRFNST